MIRGTKNGTKKGTKRVGVLQVTKEHIYGSLDGTAPVGKDVMNEAQWLANKVTNASTTLSIVPSPENNN